MVRWLIESGYFRLPVLVTVASAERKFLKIKVVEELFEINYVTKKG
jgi:hypothetical protein